MKKYRNKEKNANLFVWLIGEAFLIFVIATVSIALYDMYINIEVKPEESYIAEKTKQEITIKETEDISETLENVSKSIVRNFQNYIKR